ncbi:MAG: hypothetical protein LBL39_05985 [Planctomycetaceae bacterium]|jgi:tetratricopeptide (TPR) repeat protein|nr:hypothetical protein [Planctomycetaceae bacterium]
MNQIENVLDSLKSSLTFENPTILVLGLEWFRDNIISPVTYLVSNNIDISELDEIQNDIFFMALQAAGDIAFLLRGYGTANYWYKIFHSFNANEQENIYDIAFTYEMIGDFDNARKYYLEYFGDNNHDELHDVYELDSLTIKNIYDQLISFQPKLIIDSYSHSDQFDIYRLATTAYFILGKEAENEVYSRMEYYFKNADMPSIDLVDLFYAADYFCDQHQFWKIISKYEPNTELTDHNFDLRFSTNEMSISKVKDSILLHLARTSADLDAIKNLLNNDYLHNAAAACLKFFDEQNRTPTWKEFYVLMDALKPE